MRIKKFVLATAPAAIAVIAAGCGGGAHGAPPSGSTKVAGSTIAVRASKLGALLVDGSGRTVYLFEADRTPASTCYSACASIWPPLIAKTAPTAGRQAAKTQLGTIKRRDGQTQVTYRGHPLYYYAGDQKPGATAGQGLNQFGAKWYVVAPSGHKIDTDAR
jgi:predicted lipoprotein with Yx(FWY)xxD motif